MPEVNESNPLGEAARWQLEFPLSYGPKSPAEAAEFRHFMIPRLLADILDLEETEELQEEL